MTIAHIDQPRMGQEQLDLLKRTLANDLTDDEFSLFAQVCQRTGLDPFMRQIYAVKRGSGGDRKMVLQVGIDGYRLIADRTGKYAGSDDAEFEGTTKCANKEVPAVARVSVWKLVGNLRVAFSASARWAEYYPGDGGVGTMWRKMPHVMLAKVAEALALRKAFPAELSGLYTQEEMDQAGDVVDVPGAPSDGSGSTHEADSAPAPMPAPASPAPKAEIDELRTRLELMQTSAPDLFDAFAAWKNDQDIPWPWPHAAVEVMHDKIDALIAGAEIAADPGELGPSPEDASTSHPAREVDDEEPVGGAESDAGAVSPGSAREPSEREQVAQAQLAAVKSA